MTCSIIVHKNPNIFFATSGPFCKDATYIYFHLYNTKGDSALHKLLKLIFFKIFVLFFNNIISKRDNMLKSDSLLKFFFVCFHVLMLGQLNGIHIQFATYTLIRLNYTYFDGKFTMLRKHKISNVICYHSNWQMNI